MCYHHVLALAVMTSVYTSTSAVAYVNLENTGIQAFLSAHNTERLRLGIPNLVWNATLSRSAGEHAVKCVFKHSNGPYGENLFASSPSSNNVVSVAKKSVNSWLSERPRVVDPKWPCLGSLACGHYTQVVWRRTKTVGCAIVHCGGNLANLVVCQYYPSGNYLGQAPY